MNRSLWRPLASFSVLVLTILSFVYYFGSHPLVRHQLQHTSLATLGLVFGLYVLVLLALILVSYATLLVCRVKLSASETSILTLYATVINFFGPLQSGPAFRGVYLKRKHGLSLKKYTLASLVFYGLYALFSAFFLLATTLGWWLIGGGFVLLAGLIYFSNSKLSITSKLQTLNLKAIYLLAAATLFQLTLVAIIYYVELHSISSTIHFSQAVVYAGAANFSLFVSLTPGAIGFRETFLLFAQRLHHVPTSVIVAANTIDRAMYIVLLGVIGLLILFSHAQRRLQSDN